MLLVKINKTTFVNPEHITQIKWENEVDEQGEPINTKAWYIYMQDSTTVRTNRRFNVKEFIRRSR